MVYREEKVIDPDFNEEQSSVRTHARISSASSSVLENQGAVYTPYVLATWAAELLAHYMPVGIPVRVIDPACGDGALLKAVAQKFQCGASLIGFDIDQIALDMARNQLPNLTAHRLNSLQLLDHDYRLSATRIGDYDAVIMNPPWGADPGFTRPQLREMGYSLANGQFDTYDLFLELSLSLLKPGGLLVAIIPDSLFLPEHEPLRRILANDTQMEVIARLGEGFFEGVFRGTSVLVIRKKAPLPGHRVICLRLTKEWRRRVLGGDTPLSEASRVLAHTVQQQRFSNDISVRFDIDLKETEERIVNKIAGYDRTWTSWFTSGRGVELSKMGRVLRCPICDAACPLPRIEAEYVTCRECSQIYPFQSSTQEILVRPKRADFEETWRPFIVGENVDRYQCAPSRDIRLGVRGINYKSPSTFTPRKLLLRKTGLGIKAAIDESGAYTNQVVFHYILKAGLPDFLMNYVLGVLNSRTLLAFHLKSLGETEWRSHPYITQKVIAALPVPKVQEGTWQWRQALAIAEAVGDPTLSKQPGGPGDLYIERLCSGLFGLSIHDFEWVLGVLEDTEGLEPLRTLRLSDPSLLSPMVVQ